MKVCHDDLAVVDRLSQQYGCSRGHDLSSYFAGNFENFGMFVILDKPVPVWLLHVGIPQIEKAFEARLFVQVYVISEFQETLLECVLVFVVLSA